MAALGMAARSADGRPRCLTGLSQAVVAALAGIDRDDDFVEAELEEPGCLLAFGPWKACLDFRARVELSPKPSVEAGGREGRAN